MWWSKIKVQSQLCCSVRRVLLSIGRGAVGGGEELLEGWSRIKVYRQLCCRVQCAAELRQRGGGGGEERRVEEHVRGQSQLRCKVS